jgi:hypothetical protein
LRFPELVTATHVDLPVQSGWGLFVRLSIVRLIVPALGRSPMTRILFVRCAGALGVTALALFFVGLIPFLSAEPSAGAGLTATFSVNHEYKGDRLPLPSDINSAVSRNDIRSRRHLQMPAEVPVGCEPAFSPVSAPHMAYFYGRCMA